MNLRNSYILYTPYSIFLSLSLDSYYLSIDLIYHSYVKITYSILERFIFYTAVISPRNLENGNWN